MRRRRFWAGLAAGWLLAALLGPSARAADPAGLAVAGPDGTGRTFASGDLAALPAVTQDITFQGEHGTTGGRFTGPLLWTVLQQAGVIPAQTRAHVRLTVTATGSDGYAAVLALGEIDPEFENKPVLLATVQDGHPVGGTGLRMIVPGDKRGGRSVRDVAHLTVGP